MGSSRPELGCAVVNTDIVPAVQQNGQTIANRVLAMVFLVSWKIGKEQNV
jgi:hypothetical protein